MKDLFPFITVNDLRLIINFTNLMLNLAILNQAFKIKRILMDKRNITNDDT